mgnify:FL=1
MTDTRKVFQLLLDVRGGTEIISALKDKEYVPIEIVSDPTGQMKMYQQGEAQYNPRYVISVVYFAKDARVNGKPI